MCSKNTNTSKANIKKKKVIYIEDDEEEKKRKRSLIFWCIISISIVIGIFAGVFVINYIYGSKNNEPNYNEVTNKIRDNLLSSLDKEYKLRFDEEYKQLDKLISLSFDSENDKMLYSASSKDNSVVVTGDVTFTGKNLKNLDSIKDEVSKDNYKFDINEVTVKDVTEQDNGFFSLPSILSSYKPHNNDIYKIGEVSNPDNKYINVSYLDNQKNLCCLTDYKHVKGDTSFTLDKLTKYVQTECPYTFNLVQNFIIEGRK